MTDDPPSKPDLVRSALAKVLASPEFKASEKRKRFLAYVVEETLAGRGDRLKGFTIGVDVYERGPDFDAQADPVVRLEAGRLRKELDHYYLTEGGNDPIRLEIPTGGYVPAFRKTATGADNSPGPAGETTEANETPDHDRPRRRFVTGPVVALVAVLVVAIWIVVLGPGRVLWSGVPSRVAGQTVYLVPFAAVTPTGDETALARGLSVEVASALASFAELRVYPVTPDFLSAEQSWPVGDHEELGRQVYVLSGSVQVVGTQVRLTARLQSGADGLQVWTEQYTADYQPQELFDIQDRIAVSVSRELAEPFGRLRELTRRSIGPRHDPSLAAYRCVLIAYEYRVNFTSDLHASARECLEQAVASDPDYARAWALLTYLYVDEVRAFLNVRPDPLGRATTAAQRAVELDPDDVLSHQAMSVALFTGGDVDGALTAARTAIDLNPHNNEALFQLGMRVALSGDWEAGTSLVERAIAESPVAPPWYHFVPAMSLYVSGDYQQARERAEAAGLPSLVLAEALRAATYGQLGLSDRAAEALAKCRRLDPQFDTRARDWFAVHQLPDTALDGLMDGLYKAGLPRPSG